ncbi:MAG: tetratricopeptide repeat protein [Huintestinicola sp.]
MGSQKNGRRGFWRTCAEAGYIAAVVFGILLIIFGTVGNGGAEYTVCGGALLFLIFAVQVWYGFYRLFWLRPDYITDYDMSVIGRNFLSPSKRMHLFGGVELLKDGVWNESLEIFRELEEAVLSSEEKGIVSFYEAICLNRMGYSTNAAHAAADAFEKGIRPPDSLLMAARCFSAAGSSAEASEYYEKLLEIVEKDRIFPFVFIEAGREYLTGGHNDKAKKCFERALEEGTDVAAAQGGMALASLAEGKEDEACEWYRLALMYHIPDAEGFRTFSSQICTANGYAADFLETHLRERQKSAAAE